MHLWKQEIGCLMQREEKKPEDGEHVFFKVLGKNFLLTSKVVYGWPSIKCTSWKGNYMLYYHVVLLKVD